MYLIEIILCTLACAADGADESTLDSDATADTSDSGPDDSGSRDDSADSIGDSTESGDCTELIWFSDADGDGYGDPAESRTACEAPDGFVVDATDCDDSHAEVHPGADERWTDGMDDDCDGALSTTAMDSLFAWEAVGTLDGAWLGVTIDSSGDFDGDGDSDLVLGGMTGQLDGASRQGTVLVFNGPLDSAGGAHSPADAKAALYAAMFSGASIVCAPGDLDADGMGDLVVGSPQGGDEGQGIAYIVDGPFDGELDLTLEPHWYDGSARGAALGACAAPGDVDGDGSPDAVLGASDLQNNAGRGEVYLLRGPVEHDSLDDADQVLAGEDDREYIGFNVTALGDVDGTGTSDYAVSNAEITLAPVDGVSTYVLTEFTPGRSHPRDAGVTVHYDLGIGVRNMVPSGVGDVDGDGYDDVALGVNQSGSSDTLSIIPGPFGTETALDVSSSAAITLRTSIDEPEPWLSFAATLGDWNHDGTGAIAIADPGYAPSWAVGPDDCAEGEDSCSFGAVFLMAQPIEPGNYDVASQADRLEGVFSHGYLGGGNSGPAMRGGTDLDGDGMPDLAVSAWYANGTSANAGHTYVVFGGGTP